MSADDDAERRFAAQLGFARRMAAIRGTTIEAQMERAGRFVDAAGRLAERLVEEGR